MKIKMQLEFNSFLEALEVLRNFQKETQRSKRKNKQTNKKDLFERLEHVMVRIANKKKRVSVCEAWTEYAGLKRKNTPNFIKSFKRYLQKSKKLKPITPKKLYWVINQQKL